MTGPAPIELLVVSADPRTSLLLAEAFSLDIRQVKKVLAQCIPEWRFTCVVAVADDFGNHCVGKALRVGGDEHQAGPGKHLRRGCALKLGVEMKTSQQGMCAEVLA